MQAGDRPLRIAFVAYRGNMQCGGQGIYLWFLARELARLGHRLDVFVGPPYPAPMPFAAQTTLLPNEQYWGKWFARSRAAFKPPREDPLRALRPLHFYELAASRLGFLPEPAAFSLRALGAVTRCLRAGRRYDLIHDVQCLGYGLLPLRALGTAVVSTVHHPLSVDRRASLQGDESFRDRLGSLQFYPLGMQAFVAKRLDAILTSSEASARAIRRDFGVLPARISMVANGLDTELFCPNPAVPKQANEILCVGRASDPNKGIRTLLAALARLPQALRLTLVDAHASPARKWASELGCAARVTLTGPVSQAELIQLYQRASVVAVPSRYEGFGLPAAEAMACGTPVVASHAGALPELMARCQGGVTVPRDDPAALATALAELLSAAAAERRAALARRSRPRVVEAFAWPKVAARTVAVYREVLKQRSRAR